MIAMDRAELRQHIRREGLKRLRARFSSNIALSNALGDGFAPSYISQLLNGHRGIGDDIATKIEDRLKLSPGYLDEIHDTHPANTEPGPAIRGAVPLISWVQAGEWSQIVDNFSPGDAEDWMPCPRRFGPRTFALRVRGISMEPKYQDGDIIFVDPDAQVEHGKNVVVRLDDECEATFKQFMVEGNRRYLRALNPAWPNPVLQIDGEATICGVVIGKWVPE